MSYHKTRNCPNCNIELKYKNRLSYWECNKRNTLCKLCANIQLSNYQITNRVATLLNDMYDSFYWIGFIYADGNISKNSTRIQIGLAIKDIEHLRLYTNYVGSKLYNTETVCTTGANDMINVPKICEKFDLKERKTFHPPDIKIFDKFSYNEMLSIFVGFIDGDGYIGKRADRPDFKLSIKCHSSWVNILQLFSNLFLDNCTVKINNDGYALLNCTNTKILKRLKVEALNLNIPLMSRKWDVINLNFIGRNEISDARIELVTNLLKLGYSQSEMRKMPNFNIKQQTLSKICINIQIKQK